MTRDWLLTAAIGGAVFRFAVQERTVDGDVYLDGFDADTAVWTQGIDEDVSVTVFGSRELRDKLLEFDTGTATIALLDGDSVTTFHTGTIVAPALGAPDEPVDFTISRQVPSEVRGRQLPDETSRVDDTTWPVASGEIGSSGIYYPVIFGYPGFQGTGVEPICVVPCPLAQLTASTGTTYVVVSEDAGQAITSVRVRKQADNSEDDESVTLTLDLLDKPVRVAPFTAAGALPASGFDTFLVGYSDAGGGGPRTLYDAIVYVLQRWGPESVDWGLLPSSRGILEPYLVDTWVMAPVADPWVLVEHWLQELPINIRVGARGFYLTERRFSHDPRRVVRALADPVRVSAVTRSGPPMNTASVLYAPDAQAGWRHQILVVGDAGTVKPAGEAVDPTVVYETLAARKSHARYGPKPGGTLPLDWCWDAGTARAVAEARIEATALPALMVEYEVAPNDARGLVEGDEVLITDPDMGWDERPAILEEPPAVGLGIVRLALRVPQT